MRVLVYLLIALPGFAVEPWSTPASQWTEENARQILLASPWAKSIPGSGLTVRWESARPIRLALEKLKAKALEFDYQTCYAIAVAGVAATEVTPANHATLKAHGRDAITSFAVRIQDRVMYFLFPRSEELREPVVFRLPVGIRFRNDVEFETSIDGRKIKLKFCLNTMAYRGKLEL
jgi:hypothetical protein